MSYIYQEPLHGDKLGVVFGSFAPLHQGHIDIIMKAKKENDAGCIVIVCGYDGDKGEPLMTHHKRYRYVREYFADDPMVAVYAINDTKIGIGKYPTGWDGWLEEFSKILWTATTGNPDRVWYVGETNYKDDLEQRGEKVVLLDRGINPISATLIRNNPHKYWDKMAWTFRRVFSHNILITGTASEGKSTLVKDLGKYFNTTYSHEYARDYMIENSVHDTELDFVDFLAFLNGQYQLNKKMINSPMNKGVFFADTDSLVTEMYARQYVDEPECKLDTGDYVKLRTVANSLARKCEWDKIFLISPHPSFVDDHSRYMENADYECRISMYKNLRRSIATNGLWNKVVILDGDYQENFETIKKYVEGVLKND